MRRLMISILLLITLYSEGQIINASSPYRTYTESCINKILDNYGTNNYGGFAVFKLKCSYTGSCLRVRRSSDNEELDIGFLSSGELDTAAMKTFIGANSAYVTKMYNQNGTSNNAVQSTPGKQPIIMNAGVIYRFSGKPSPYWDGTNRYFVFENSGNKSRLDIYYVHSTSDVAYVQFITETNEEDAWGYLASNNANTTYRQNIPNSSLYVNNTLISVSTRADVYNALNGTKIITLEYFKTGASVNLKFTNYSTAGIYFTGYVNCFLIYDADVSANRSNINNAINSIYSIY